MVWYTSRLFQLFIVKNDDLISSIDVDKFMHPYYIHRILQCYVTVYFGTLLEKCAL